MKYTTTLAALWAIGAVSAASITNELNALSSEASSLKDKVDKWSRGSGLEGALSIQESFPKLQDAVKALNQASLSASDADVDVDAVKNMVSHVDGLLSSLSSKGGDFKAVGAQEIVKQDISSMAQASVQVVNNLVKAVGSDCTKVEELNPSVKSFSSEFQNAKNVYGFSGGDLPSQITCTGKQTTTSARSKAAVVSKNVDASYSSTTTFFTTAATPYQSGAMATAETPIANSGLSTDPSAASPASDASQASSAASTSSNALQASSAAASAPIMMGNRTMPGSNHTMPVLSNGSPKLNSAIYFGLAVVALPLMI